MTRLPRTVGALALAMSVVLGTSAGLAFGDETPRSLRTTSETPPLETPPLETPPPEATIPSSAVPSTPVDATTSEPSEPRGEPAAVTEQPDLRLTVAFDKASYEPADLVLLRATIVNVGAVAASTLWLESSGNLTPYLWRFEGSSVADLAPGESVQAEASAYVADVAGGVVRVTVEVQADQVDAQPADNTTTVTAPLRVVRSGFTGLVYGDLNANQAPDPGEALAGLRVYTSGGAPTGFYETVADSEGRFAFHGLLAGSYTVYGDSPDWVFPGAAVRVDGSGEPDVPVRGDNRVDGWLTGTLAFTQPTYAAGDTARLVVTLTNSGRGSIAGLIAVCTSTSSAAVDYGELTPDAAGATVPAASTRIFEIDYPVDASTANAGFLEVSCLIGKPPDHYGMVKAAAATRVPGLRAARVVGRLLTQDTNHCGCRPTFRPVPDTKLYLRHQLTGQIMARDTTDANGRFEFLDIPADRYDVGVVGPWTGESGTTPVLLADALADGSRTHVVIVVPGPDQPDPEPAPIPPPTGDAGGTPEPAPLAATGATLGWLAIAGLVSLVGGAGLVFGTRRRTA
ncbi:LPXTG cell wall anchor domain-containing protein [Saccharothrix variisporea]|uniref:LPXTG-motif cell wall-anchored protein n=1 Tax=Saccharothrix variisporea TaxID=543527 RepID=A0A495XL52_9PSEU|nr:LPXTG cell wall anchor domain-containing protein [Saccharothrix variisporea]RKT74379.1 LPXTG-motif cell wall-anchored protein [Saccharothrix variisporea]